MIFEKKKFRLLFFIGANLLSIFVMLLMNELLDMDESVILNAMIFLLDIPLFFMFDSKDNDGKFAAGSKNIFFIILWIAQGLVALIALIFAIQEASDAKEIFFSSASFPAGYEYDSAMRYTSVLSIAAVTMVPISVIGKLWVLTLHRHHDYLPNWAMTFFSPCCTATAFILALLLALIGYAAKWLFAWGAFFAFAAATTALIIYVVKVDLPFSVASYKRHSADSRSVAGKSAPKPGTPEEWFEKELLKRCSAAAPYSREHYFFHHISLNLKVSVDYGKKVVHVYYEYTFYIDQYVQSQDGSPQAYQNRIDTYAKQYIEGLGPELENVARTAGAVCSEFMMKYPAYSGNWSFEPHYDTDSVYMGE